ncbi:MAG: hypothetical protein JNN28_07940 [Saprospiraceae bacterium]|nr:hypothetical protein [Saprospiraceae bacterium]
MKKNTWKYVALFFLLINTSAFIYSWLYVWPVIKELDTEGVTTIGVIDELPVERSTDRYRNETYYVNVAFEADGGEYFIKENIGLISYNGIDRKHYYTHTHREVKIGDTLDIRYLSRDPWICRIEKAPH